MVQFVVVVQMQMKEMNYSDRRLGTYQALGAGPCGRRIGESAGEEILDEK